MPLPYFENALNSGFIQTPNDYFRELQQASIDGLFDCTSAKYTIQEQDEIGSSSFHDIEVWLDYIVGTTSSGVKNGNDFTKVIFQDIDHFTIQGLYYIFDNNYHISYFYNKYDGLEKSVAVRRCNNAMKIIDPQNGSIFSIPCVIDYDMTSPNQQVSSYIITPNNHATVMVQGNEDTLRLFKLNTRYMFNGRPFKLLAYQNALYYDLTNQAPTLLYLDLYLDELHDKDDVQNGIAYNGEYNYSININADNMNLVSGTNGQLTATVQLNGVETEVPISWSSSDLKTVFINLNGEYNVLGQRGSNATITAALEGNKEIFDTININVVDSEVLQPLVLLNPTFNKIRQFESIAFTIEVMYGSTLITPDIVEISLSPNKIILSNQYIDITQTENQYIITANAISLLPQTLYINIKNTTPSIENTTEFIINVVSMLG